MHVLIVNNTQIPIKDYGGTERIIWWLGKELIKMNHQVSYLVAPGSHCPFAENVLEYNPSLSIDEQIPDNIDFVHINFQINQPIKKPYVITHHVNFDVKVFDKNTIFVSRDHANRNGSDCFVYNGIDIEDYGQVNFNLKRKHLLFLAGIKRPEKNIFGCIEMSFRAKENLAVLGGRRRFDWYLWCWWVKYYGMKAGALKNQLLNESKALLFPVLWHEPFGIAIIEAMYFGTPVFGTLNGSLPELIPPFAGALSNSCGELVKLIKKYDSYDRKKIHEYVCEKFNSKNMAKSYLKKYEQVLNGQPLNINQPKELVKHEFGEWLKMDP